MTLQEITLLRKSGHLTDALAAAEAEFARAANGYTGSSLFWCLNDLQKSQIGSELEATINRMRDLNQAYGEGNDYMQRTMASVERKALPHAARLKELLAQVKSGNVKASEAHREILAIFQRGEMDKRLYADFAWLTYYALKETDLNNAYERKVLLNLYFQLEPQKPDILHSLILGEAIKVEQTTPLQFRIRDFIRLWGLQNLRDEDWSQFTTDDGKTLPSPVEKLIGVYVRELKTDGVAAPEEFAKLVDKALGRYPKSQNMPYFKAVVLLSMGRNEEALKYYKNLILKFPAKFYLWHQASGIVDDIDTKIGLLSKALSCGDDDGFLGSVRLDMVDALMQKNLPANAKTELEAYRATYQKNSWSLKPEFWERHNRLAAVEPAPDNKSLYAEYAVGAEQFIYSELPEEMAVKVADRQLDDPKRPGRKIQQWILRTQSKTLRLKKPAKFGLPGRMSNGTFFTIKTLEDKIVWIRQTPPGSRPAASWIKEVTGPVEIRTDRRGNKFAILKGVYINETLLKNTTSGQIVTILALQQPDTRWQALTLTPPTKHPSH